MGTRYQIKTSSKVLAKKFHLKVGKKYAVTHVTQEWGYKYYYIINEKKRAACICPLTWGNKFSLVSDVGDGELVVEQDG